MNGTLTVRRSEQGFTLVELAIVMIIIGLLIGGILKGQELIANSRVVATVSQVKGYDAATTTFRDKFAAMPGDMVNAGQRLVNCNGACVVAAGGAAGDGRVDTNANGFAAAPGAENIAYWLQMSAADLVSGINPGAGLVWGGDFPEAKIAGGFDVAYVDAAGDMPGTPAVAANVRAGHYLALHDLPNQAVPATGVITPNQAFRIDTKLDDGVPDTGTVFSGGAGTCTANIAGQLSYNEQNDITDCNLFIRFQQ